jgi:hypothetical protein
MPAGRRGAKARLWSPLRAEAANRRARGSRCNVPGLSLTSGPGAAANADTAPALARASSTKQKKKRVYFDIFPLSSRQKKISIRFFLKKPAFPPVFRVARALR